MLLNIKKRFKIFLNIKVILNSKKLLKIYLIKVYKINITLNLFCKRMLETVMTQTNTSFATLENKYKSEHKLFIEMQKTVDSSAAIHQI
jgi:hypothetical protein